LTVRHATTIFGRTLGSTRRQSLLALVVAALGGCSFRAVSFDGSPNRSRCESDLCAQVVHFSSNEAVIGVWIDAPPATRLDNAWFSIDEEEPCRGRKPVEWVAVDGDVRGVGPAAIGGAHGLLLGFPLDMRFAHGGVLRATFVDVGLDVAGMSRCVRLRLTDEQGHAAVGR
jgi:hypothetical protein